MADHKVKTSHNEELPLKVTTFNVLKPAQIWDIVQGYVATTEPRYKYQIDTLFPQLDQDIFSLQEVTPEYIELLEDSEFYKSGNYEHTPADALNKYGHFPMIVSRLPFDLLYNKDHILICLFKSGDKNIIAIDAHLDPVEGNRDVRQKQIEAVDSILTTMADDSLTQHKDRVNDALNNNNVLFMGDLNIYFPGENQVLEDNDFFDLWLEKHSHDEGLTWDPTKNTMNHFNSFFDDRRLRYDRICMKQSKQFDIKNIKMIATDKIETSDLYASDHFGLAAEFSPSSHGFIPAETEFKQEFSMLPQNNTGFSTDTDILFMKIASLITILLFVLSFLCSLSKVYKKIFTRRSLPKKLPMYEITKDNDPRKKLT
jgi:endonuclease/exonuclease/phosphatase family metal-dependent hydrolase